MYKSKRAHFKSHHSIRSAKVRKMKTFVAVLALAAVVAADNGATKHVHPKADPHHKQIYYDSVGKKDVHTTYHKPVHHEPAYHSSDHHTSDYHSSSDHYDRNYESDYVP